MSKSEQTGGGGTETTPRKEPKPKEKRPWRKPRVYLVDFAQTEGLPTQGGVDPYVESEPFYAAYDPNIS